LLGNVLIGLSDLYLYTKKLGSPIVKETSLANVWATSNVIVPLVVDPVMYSKLTTTGSPKIPSPVTVLPISTPPFKLSIDTSKEEETLAEVIAIPEEISILSIGTESITFTSKASDSL